MKSNLVIGEKRLVTGRPKLSIVSLERDSLISEHPYINGSVTLSFEDTKNPKEPLVTSWFKISISIKWGYIVTLDYSLFNNGCGIFESAEQVLKYKKYWNKLESQLEANCKSAFSSSMTMWEALSWTFHIEASETVIDELKEVCIKAYQNKLTKMLENAKTI